jgi:hypothetical protein
MPGFNGAREIIYDNQHAKLRAAAFKVLPEYSPCARCHRVMWKHELEKPDKRGRRRSALHYDHDGRRTGYLGFSCADCNRKAGAKEGGRRATHTYGHRRRAAVRPSVSGGTPGPGW